MLDREDILFSSGPGLAWALYQSKFGRKKFNVQLDVVSDDWYLFQVQGPKSIQLLDEMADTTVRDIASMNSKEISLSGHKALCLRQGVSGEHGFELWGPASEGPSLYNAIATFGQNFGIRRLGGRTKSVNHVRPHSAYGLWRFS
jgi:glycine cleavage system aminomethyltransferase T